MPSVIAIAAHPDDIEFVMAGTLLQLVARGWDAHYFNIANGCCGSMTMDRDEAAAVRLQEAKQAASLIPATFHPPICNDMEVFYNSDLLAQVAAAIRESQASIVLTHSLVDYMEDHQNAARLAVSAAFVRGMPNFRTSRPAATYEHDVAVYHAQPHGNRTPLGEHVIPTHFVDVSSQIEKKKTLLSCHESQGAWLDDTQKISSYLSTLEDLNREVGQFSGRYDFAEGWRRHWPLGFSAADYDPLKSALQDALHVQEASQ